MKTLKTATGDVIAQAETFTYSDSQRGWDNGAGMCYGDYNKEFVLVGGDTEWLIDIGPFFDRFGAAKLAVLASTDATVRAIVQDVMARKWVDLKRADVALSFDVLIAKAIPGVTVELKDAVINTPVMAEENLALRKLFFS